jgi:carbonic anhydrase/acetyltransferase-like protein (isoleucine patch superfamily)
MREGFHPLESPNHPEANLVSEALSKRIFSRIGGVRMTSYRLGDHQPTVPEDGQYWIAPTAAVIGRVIIKKNASIWFGAVVRGDNDPIEIGENSNVQDNSVLHTDFGEPLTIGADVTVGHKVMLHGCTIGEGSLIGIGSIVLNGARIGRGCLIGAHALITEGKEIPDYSVVMGAPGKIVRQVTPEQAAGLRVGAQHYVENWKRFRATLAEI